MPTRTYNITLIVLLVIIFVGGYIIFTRKEYNENAQVTIPKNVEMVRKEEPAAIVTPNTNTPAPTFETTEQPKPTEPKPQLQANVETSVPHSETVRYTSSGFSPRTLTIKRGTRVTFVNDQEQPLWVASAPYPSHSNYPSFNQRHAVNKDGLYSFTFTEAGGYNYQNDRNPSQTGTIIVTE